LIGIDDAARLQKRMLTRIGKGDADLTAGGIRCVCGSPTKPRMFRIRGFGLRGSECPRCREGYLNGADASRSSEFARIADHVIDHIDIEDWMEVNARTKRELARSRAEANAGRTQSPEEVKTKLHP